MIVTQADFGIYFTWTELDTGNFISTGHDDEQVVIFQRRDKRWGIVAGNIFSKASFKTPEEAAEAYEQDDLSWYPPSAWRLNKKGDGWWLRSNSGMVYSIKRAKSGSWYWCQAGGKPNGWFDSRQAAQADADYFINLPY